jgi:hypothetical protein
MDLETCVRGITKCFHSLADMWAVKVILSFVITITTSTHGLALKAFTVLVIIDLITRWIAQAYKHLSDQHEKNDFIRCVFDMRKAFKAGYINSNAMKHRFVSKIIVYMILTFVAVKSDALLKIANETPLFLKMVWTYLAATEAISVLENLRDSGVGELGNVISFLRNKLTR